MEEYKKFGDLTRDEKLALVTAWVDGEKIEAQEPAIARDSWDTIIRPSWYDDVCYRIAPKPVVKPSINWDHVVEECIALAVDAYGEFTFFADIPKKEKDGYAGYGCVSSPLMFASFHPGSFMEACGNKITNWQDSLVFRPGYEPKGEGK